MRPMARSPLSYFLPFVLILLTGCGNDTPTSATSMDGGQATAPFSFNVPVAGQIRLRLEAINGTVDIAGSTSANTVSVTGVRRVRSDSAQDAGDHLPNLEVRVTEGVDVILVRTIQPEDDDRDYVVDYVITMPRELAVIVNNVNGAIDVDSINNRVTVGNVNGGIGLTNIVGSTTVGLVNGQIDARITLPLGGTIDLETVNGGIDLSIPRNTSARLEARVLNGTVTVSNLPLRNSVQTPTSVVGTLGSGRGTISLGTVNGGIEVSGF